MYQQDRIKNLSAFLNHMLKQKKSVSSCSTLSTVSRDSSHSIRTNSSVQSTNCSMMDCRSESAHYSVTSGSSFCEQINECSDLTRDTEPPQRTEPDERAETAEMAETVQTTECVHNAHGDGNGFGAMDMDRGHAPHDVYGAYGGACDGPYGGPYDDDARDYQLGVQEERQRVRQQEEEQEDDIRDSYQHLMEQFVAQSKELEVLTESLVEMEEKQKTLTAENRCLRESRGGPIAQNGYRQDGDLKRTVPGIDVVPIYCVDRSGVAQSGYLCVGIPDHVLKAATVYSSMPTQNGHAPPYLHDDPVHAMAMGNI